MIQKPMRYSFDSTYGPSVNTASSPRPSTTVDASGPVKPAAKTQWPSAMSPSLKVSIAAISASVASSPVSVSTEIRYCAIGIVSSRRPAGPRRAASHPYCERRRLNPTRSAEISSIISCGGRSGRQRAAFALIRGPDVTGARRSGAATRALSRRQPGKNGAGRAVAVLVSGSIQTTGHRQQEHDHAHRASPDADWRWLAAAGALIVLFMVGEVAAGVVAHSLALLSDAAHMLTDAAAIGLAIVTTKIAGRPARGGYTYGLRRLEILSAQANGITLVLLAVWLAYEAIRRLITPHPVTGALMLGVALAGVCVNLAASWLLARANGASTRRSLNMEGAVAHVLTDLYAFAATAIAAIIILATGFSRADPIATLVVVALMLRAGSGLIRESGRIFLEAAPADIDPSALGAAMV